MFKSLTFDVVDFEVRIKLLRVPFKEFRGLRWFFQEKMRGDGIRQLKPKKLFDYSKISLLG